MNKFSTLSPPKQASVLSPTDPDRQEVHSPSVERSSIGLSDWTYLKNSKTEQANPFPKKRHKLNLLKVLGGVRGIEIYDTTVVVKRCQLARTPGPSEIGKRKKIFNLSSKSLARLAFVAFNTPVNFPSLMTLTYADVLTDGREVKDDLNKFLSWYRYNFPGHLYLWWLEFQRRGAPHYHVLSTVDLARCGRLSTIHREDGDTWLTHWDTWQMLEHYWADGMTSWEVVNDQEGGKKYAAAYATKAYQKAVPEAYRNVGRFWGYSRDGVKPEPKSFYECSEAQLRAALERGGWEYLPNDGELLFRELYQAASKINLSHLKQVDHLPEGLTLEEQISQVTGQEVTGPVFIPHNQLSQEQSGARCFVCQNCEGVYNSWSGQCPACGQFDTLRADEVQQ